MKHALCRGCAVSYPKQKGVMGRYCSDYCKLLHPRSKEKCSPACDTENLEEKEVTFKDGTTHIRQACNVCVFSTFKAKPHNNPKFMKNRRSVSALYR